MISWTPSSEGSDCDLFSGADGAAEDLANELEIAEDRTEVFASEYEDGGGHRQDYKTSEHWQFFLLDLPLDYT